jgi:hypothetical protein
MSKTPIGKAQTEFRRPVCPLANTLDIFADKWTLLVVRDLFPCKHLYREFTESPEGIPTNILAAHLKRLKRKGSSARSPIRRGRCVMRMDSPAREKTCSRFSPNSPAGRIVHSRGLGTPGRSWWRTSERCPKGIEEAVFRAGSGSSGSTRWYEPGSKRRCAPVNAPTGYRSGGGRLCDRAPAGVRLAVHLAGRRRYRRPV